MGLDLILLTSDHPVRDEGCGVLLQDPFLLLDLLVHQWLGEHGLVHLIVPVASVTNLHTGFTLSVRVKVFPCVRQCSSIGPAIRMDLLLLYKC